LRIIIGCDSHFEGRIILGIFQRIDYGIRGQAMAEGILP
jgi:hypothetical protein